MGYKRIIFFTIIVSVFISCEAQKFTGYDYQVEELIETANVFGQVTKHYNANPVSAVLLRIGISETYSNPDGNYRIKHLITDDEKRNKPVLFTLYHPKYYMFSKEFILEPLENNIDITMIYAAPIMVKASIFQDNNTVTCQAIVKDYQGARTLESVRANILLKSGGFDAGEYQYDMQLISVSGDYTGNYQCVFELPLGADSFGRFFDITAKDDEDFEDTHRFYPGISAGTDPIF